ncbi:hypothetical protein [Diaminobutyricimonas sp. TR449]|uniref:hypothetical protein n=1 Tax=Diaminobutyricimonas sp. TR449 TaxID=2708076 RepID=UPI001AB03CA9|nr:hypothetical protein [Diaminobutyricimonas sp. TR449]
MNHTRTSPLVYLLAIVLFAECAVLAGATAFLIVELFIATPESYASAVALVVLVAIAAIWLGAIAIATLRRRPWIRGAALVWQVLQIAVAIGSFQGLTPRADIGWALLVPAVLAIVLLFTPAVVAQTSRAKPGGPGDPGASGSSDDSGRDAE